MKLAALYSPFTSFCEGPEDIENGYELFFLFHRRNFYKYLPEDRNTRILVVSSGVGYFQSSLKHWGFKDVLGIDSDPEKVQYAVRKGFESRCENCFEFLDDKVGWYDFIFVEQEVNHLTKEEFVLFLNLCKSALKPEGRVLLSAANCANPLISTEYPGNNVDHFLAIAENGIRQYFDLCGFCDVQVFGHDFYVLWKNPLNYIAKITTSSIHFLLRILFKVYGKNNKIFTKRLGVLAYKKEEGR